MGLTKTKDVAWWLTRLYMGTVPTVTCGFTCNIFLYFFFYVFTLNLISEPGNAQGLTVSYI